jgi:hypothetical protein
LVGSYLFKFAVSPLSFLSPLFTNWQLLKRLGDPR